LFVQTEAKGGGSDHKCSVVMKSTSDTTQMVNTVLPSAAT